MNVDYFISLPERLLRATAAGLGGVVYQILSLLLPGWVRGTRLYQATVARVLRILVELVGGVPGLFPTDAMPVRELAVRKVAGNAVELLSFAAVGWSPVWLLAAAADVTGGTHLYLRTFVDDLRREGEPAVVERRSGAAAPLAKVERAGGDLWRRPGLQVQPAVVAHQKDPRRRSVHDPVFDTF